LGAAARARAGVGLAGPEAVEPDPRIRVDLARLRALEPLSRGLGFLPRQPARSALNGRRASRLRGRGLNFEELRGYLPGDDVRAIDWKVTARTGRAHVRVMSEERDRPALLVVDQRMSMFFGTVHAMKSVAAAEAAALAAFRILAQGDRLGGLVISDDGLAELRPRRGRAALDRFLSSLARAQAQLQAGAPDVEPLALVAVLSAMARLAPRDHLIIVLSDFDGADEDARAEAVVAGLARRNDLLLVPVSDPSAHELPEGLHLTVSDGELQAEVDARDGEVRRRLLELASGRLGAVAGWARRSGATLLPLSSGEPTAPQLRRLLGAPPR